MLVKSVSDGREGWVVVARKKGKLGMGKDGGKERKEMVEDGVARWRAVVVIERSREKVRG